LTSARFFKIGTINANIDRLLLTQLKLSGLMLGIDSQQEQSSTIEDVLSF